MNKFKLTRRGVLRGMMAGGACTVGLPLLDCLLDGNGLAYADGSPIPPRLVTWFWGLGIGEGAWIPKTSGKDYELPRQFKMLQPLKHKFNLFSGGQVFLEGGSNTTHFTGVQGLMTGKVSSAASDYTRSLDTIIGDHISGSTRFRSIEIACDGNPTACWSARETGRQPAEVSPVALYARLFGAEFKDPNAAEFTPDPAIVMRRSVLSAVSEQRLRIMKSVPADDKARLDSYFTSLRALEQRLEIQMKKPEPLEACTVPSAPQGDEAEPSTLAVDAMARHELFGELVAHALACGQTRVVNMCITQGMSGLRREGDPTSHHTYTHEEPIDPQLGYQVNCAWFQDLYLNALLQFATKLDSIKEGDQTLLDRIVLFAYTDHGAPRLHSVLDYPVLIFGNGGGRFKTGLHIAGRGDPVTRVGFTLQQAMGVPAGDWGSGANRVTAPYLEAMV